MLSCILKALNVNLLRVEKDFRIHLQARAEISDRSGEISIEHRQSSTKEIELKREEAAAIADWLTQASRSLSLMILDPHYPFLKYPNQGGKKFKVLEL